MPISLVLYYLAPIDAFAFINDLHFSHRLDSTLSIIYLEYTKTDHQHELEAYQIGLEVHKRTSVINEYLPEVKYAYGKDDVFWNVGTFPILHSETERNVKTIKTYDSDRCTKEKQLESGCRQYDYSSLNEFIDYGKNEGLTHIIADKNDPVKTPIFTPSKLLV